MSNAIIMASGLGTRMLPLTEKTPKPLIQVLGRPMIETVIDGLEIVGVDRIFIVTGYLGGMFSYLKEKYRKIELIENPYYSTVNNISSVYAARHILRKGDCFICEADLYIADGGVFKEPPSDSCYYGEFKAGYSSDWVFDTDTEGRITRIGKGGSDTYNMVGIAFFKGRQAEILADVVEVDFGRHGYEGMFWDDVVDRHLDLFDLKIRPVEHGQIIEIDTVEELMEVERNERGK